MVTSTKDKTVGTAQRSSNDPIRVMIVDDSAVIRGLNAGAADYVAKPTASRKIAGGGDGRHLQRGSSAQ